VNFLDNVPVNEDLQEHRCSCLLLLDTSGSMASDNRIGELNRGLKILTQALNDDALARKRVEVGIITFDSSVNMHNNFTAARDFRPPTLEATGATAMGEALTEGTRILKERTQHLQQQGNTPYRPWLMLITDGGATDTGSYPWTQVASLVKDGQRNREFVFFPIGVQGADFKALAQLSETTPLELKGLKFRELFEWLSRSLILQSNSRPDEAIDLESPMGWGQIPGN